MPSCCVCGENPIEDELHFGARVCRACAAFFRRTVANNRTYHCRHRGHCAISSSIIRCMCRSCRFVKCLSVGMRKDAVQKYRDVYGRRMDDGDGEEDRTETEEMPILTLFHKNYTYIENIRRVVHRIDNGDSVFKIRGPKAITYKEASRINSRECDLMADCIINTFPGFADLPNDQKTILFRNFFIVFVILQNSYFSCVQNRPDILILANGDYIDCKRPETFYFDPDGNQKMTSEDAVKMFASSFANYRRNVTDPMFQEGVDKHEFLVLASLSLFDPGLEGQSEQCSSLCVRYREIILRDIIEYYQTVGNVSDSSMRLAVILSLLPALQRASRRFQEDVELSNVFNVYAVDDKFYDGCLSRL